LLGFDEVLTTASPKASPQTQLALEAMGEAAATTEASIHELRASLDLLHSNIARIDTTQQQLAAQLGLIADGVREST
jgi:hypothetical protein